MRFVRVAHLFVAIGPDDWVYGTFDLKACRPLDTSFAHHLVERVHATLNELLLVGLGGGFMLPGLMRRASSVDVLELSTHVARGFHDVVRHVLRDACNVSFGERLRIGIGDAHTRNAWLRTYDRIVLDYDPCYQIGRCDALLRLRTHASSSAIAYVNRWHNRSHGTYPGWRLVDVLPVTGQFAAVYFFKS